MACTIMFETFELQNLNELVKAKIGDFTSPESFHSVKVERFGDDNVKASAKVCSKFPVPISALVANFDIEPCELSDSTIPVVRPLDFATKGLIQFAKLFQRLFMELRRLYFFTSADCQKSFQPEVYPHVLTCGGQNFLGCIIGDNIEPVLTRTIAKDLDISDISVPIPVLVKRKPDFTIFQGLCVRPTI